MKQANDFSMLTWVRQELGEVFASARQAVEDSSERPADFSYLDLLSGYLKQIKGTLKIVEVNGANHLIDEVQHLADAIRDGGVSDKDNAYHSLMQALIQLPEYLDCLVAGVRDLPVVLLPMINEMRVLRGEGLLSEATMFSPDFSVVLPDEVTCTRLDDNLRKHAKELRREFQIGLLGFLREQNPVPPLTLLHKLLTTAMQVSERPDIARLWWIGSAVVTALKEGSVSQDATVKVLLGRLDLCLKRIAEEGEDVLSGPEVDGLCRGLLYCLGQSASSDQTVQKVRELFALDDLLPREDELKIISSRMSGKNCELFDTVGQIIISELESLKDTLDILMRNADGDQTNDIPAINLDMSTLSDTLGMLDLNVERELILDKSAQLERYISGAEKPQIEQYIDIAESLLQVESVIRHLSSRDKLTVTTGPGGLAIAEDHEFDQVKSVVFTEALADLSRARELLSQGMLDQDSQGMPDAVRLLSQVKGGLLLLEEERTASVVGKLETYLRQGLKSNEWLPPADERDSLADALCGVELYLEGQRTGTSVKQSLQVAEQRVAALLPLSDIDVESVPRSLVADESITEVDVTGGIDYNHEQQAPSALPSGDLENFNHQYESELEDFPVLSGEIDDEILEIFVEEAEEEIAAITGSLPAWKLAKDQEILETIRRSFHTLKGSGRLVGAIRMGEFAWVMEDLLNKVMQDDVIVDDELHFFLEQTVPSLEELLEQLKSGSPLTHSVAALMEKANHFSMSQLSADEDDLEASVFNLSLGADVNTGNDEVLPEFSGDIDDLNESSLLDPVLMSIFREETQSHLSVIDSFIQAQDCQVTDDLLRALHTLRGSAKMTQVEEIDLLSGKLERLFKKLSEQEGNLPGFSYGLLERGREYISDFLEQLPGDIKKPDGFDDYIYLLEQETLATAAPEINVNHEGNEPFAEEEFDAGQEMPDATFAADPYSHCDTELLPIFLDEGEELLGRIDATLAVWSSSVGDTEVTDRLLRELHTLKGSARMVSLPPIAELAHSMESLIVDVSLFNAQDDVESIACIQVAHDRLHNQLELLQLREPLRNCDALLDKLQATQIRLKADQMPGKEKKDREAVDPELLNIFIEEAEDILNLSESTLQRWKADPHDLSLVAELQRELHTLKGGARMADVSEVGDLAHAIESLLVQATRGRLPSSDNLFIILERSIDRLSTMIACLRHTQPLPETTDLIHYLAALDRGEAIEVKATEPVDKNTESEKSFVDRRKSLRVSHELVRVRADMLDQLVNHAGEVSIYRSRLEQQIGSYRFNMGEMDQTIHRLRSQLRKMEIETEAQILFRYEKDESASDFDPLEMDRYSQLQQLSRSLMESVADLSSIQGMLDNITRESETLLLQQSRVSSDLQEGLMRTRMVPFLSLAPRLRRIVRQTSEELGKRVELAFSGGEGELDRTVIDRIIAPIEHMLRNAIAHGLEKPATRVALGKPEVCCLNIDFSRDASDVVLRISDDGAGIDIAKVRDRAVMKGIVEHDTALTDQEILQLILESGLSTADEVTQVAGRGVGMDVVNSEVKQLGGSLKIESEKDRGAAFVIRLPFTVALNNALLVDVGEDSYAIPLTNIQGVVRVQKDELRKYYDNKSELLEYGGQKYEVHYLGELLGTHRPVFSAMKNTESLLLVNSKDYSVALQVDNLSGSREIVVKSVGRQISTVHGVSGATILGDGRVVMILELAPLLRIGASLMAQVDELLQEPVSSDETTVMVVDDSITVRKVTGRLLQKQGFQVVTARDGIDAVARLHEVIPDIILTDIEMPRMDGFELSAYIRNDSRLKDVPIVMITSRAGHKHRQKAIEIGVNEYLGKPFQESDLMDTIRQFVVSEPYGNG
ncbi:MAG: Hpt domain-containing protein [Gammaproteobacteria bacterium]